MSLCTPLTVLFLSSIVLSAEGPEGLKPAFDGLDKGACKKVFETSNGGYTVIVTCAHNGGTRKSSLDMNHCLGSKDDGTMYPKLEFVVILPESHRNQKVLI